MPGPAALAPPHALPSRAPRRRPRLRAVLVAPLLLIFAVAGPACSDDEPESPTAGDTLPDTTTTEPAPTTTAPTTTTPPTPEEEVKAAYLDIIESSFRRLEDPTLDDPTVEQNHIGSNRDTVLAELKSVIESEQVAKFPGSKAPAPEIISLELESPERATVRSCLIDNTQLIDEASGDVVNDVVSSNLEDATLVKTNGTWKLQLLTLVERWEDGEGCLR